MAIENTKATPRLDSALRWVGDLDHPFYQDERQRFVWYEASAIAFQLLLLLQLLLAGVLMLALGRGAVPYVAVSLLPTIFTTVIASAYAHKRGAQYFASSSDLRRSRGFAALALMILYLAGLARIGFDGGIWGDSDGFDPTLVIGGVIGFGGAFVGMWLGKRRQAAAESALDED